MKIAVLINILPTYREGFYRRLLARRDLQVDIYCHERIEGSSMRSAHAAFPDNVKLVRGSFFMGGNLVISWVPWRKLLSGYDAVCVDGNPRYLSHALVATLLRLMGRNVVLWTMARSFQHDARREWVRLTWSRLFDRLLVYNEQEVAYLRAKGFRRQQIVAINNGLDQDVIAAAAARWTPDRLRAFAAEHGLAGRPVLLACARLEPKNRFDLLLDALPALIERHPGLVLCLVGAGSEEARLKQQVRDLGLEDAVRMPGAIFDEDALAPWFLSAWVLVHPAAIGLSILHAFGYGLPVVTHANAAAHGPEFSAFEDGVNGVAFREGERDDLVRAVSRVLSDDDFRARARRASLDIVTTTYNVGVMAERFLSVVQRGR